VSADDPRALETLAQWRRAGYGTWRATFIIEGYDDSEEVVLPGRWPRAMAIKHGRAEVSDHLGTAKKWIHLQSIKKEG